MSTVEDQCCTPSFVINVNNRSVEFPSGNESPTIKMNLGEADAIYTDLPSGPTVNGILVQPMLMMLLHHE